MKNVFECVFCVYFFFYSPILRILRIFLRILGILAEIRIGRENCVFFAYTANLFAHFIAYFIAHFIAYFAYFAYLFAYFAYSLRILLRI